MSDFSRSTAIKVDAGNHTKHQNTTSSLPFVLPYLSFPFFPPSLRPLVLLPDVLFFCQQKKKSFRLFVVCMCLGCVRSSFFFSSIFWYTHAFTLSNGRVYLFCVWEGWRGSSNSNTSYTAEIAGKKNTAAKEQEQRQEGKKRALDRMSSEPSLFVTRPQTTLPFFSRCCVCSSFAGGG